MAGRIRGYASGMELVFEVREAEEGGYFARALGHSIFTQAESWNELRVNVLEVTSLHFEECDVRPRSVRMHYTRDESLLLFPKS